MGNVMNVLIFQSMREFLTRFPPEEAILPVAIHSPDSADCMFYSITIALPVQNRFYECRVYNACTGDMMKYRRACKRPFELAIGLVAQ